MTDGATDGSVLVAVDDGATARTLQRVMDDAPLNRSFWVSFALLSLASAVDFFDYFIAGFLVSVVAPLWHLTYGQSAVILLGAGVGGMAGSLLGGYLSDRFGRKRVIVVCAILCGASAGAVALIPDGAWLTFAALRCLAGIFISCVYAATVALVTEMTPTRHRTIIAPLSFVTPSAGILLATVTSASLLDLLGWRGVAALATAPALVGLACAFLLPESVLWLIAKGRDREACAVASSRIGRPVEIPFPAAQRSAHESSGYFELLSYPREVALIFLIWFGVATAVYGVYAWGPTILSLTRGISTQEAARLFLWVSVCGVIGKVVFSFVPHWLGRKLTGQVTTGIGLVLLAMSALTHNLEFAGLPVFLLALAAGDFFYEGGAAGISPYSAEVFPVRLAGHGAGVGQFGSAVGKITGPLALALIAGSNNLVAPKATGEAILPGFMFLTGCLVITFLAFTFFGIETRGKQLQVLSEPETNIRPAQS